MEMYLYSGRVITESTCRSIYQTYKDGCILFGEKAISWTEWKKDLSRVRARIVSGAISGKTKLSFADSVYLMQKMGLSQIWIDSVTGYDICSGIRFSELVSIVTDEIKHAESMHYISRKKADSMMKKVREVIA